MSALHNEILTHRDLLGRLDFLEGTLGFGSGNMCALAGLGKFRLLILKVALQGLVLLDGVLELLLDLTDPSLMLFACGLFLRRPVLGFGQRLLESLCLGRCP